GLFGEGSFLGRRRRSDGGFGALETERLLGEGGGSHKGSEIVHFKSPRASVQTQTSSAPCRFRTWAQALVVAPVVSTSSTRTTRLPLRIWREPLQAKAPWTLAARSERDSLVCVRVGVTRQRRSARTGM